MLKEHLGNLEILIIILIMILITILITIIYKVKTYRK